MTKSRIRFRRCGPTWANTLMSKTCTFHSHPAGWATADVPSESDIFQFLYFRHLRMVTVGATRLWVWDKTATTLATVKKLLAWSEANLLGEARSLSKESPGDWSTAYMKLALKNLGLSWPKRFRDWDAQWQEMLRTILKIRVRVFPHVPGRGG